jgi:hypothetical protein
MRFQRPKGKAAAQPNLARASPVFAHFINAG